MSDQRTGSGWQPLSRPNLSRSNPDAAADGADLAASAGPSRFTSGGSVAVSPFVRLARTHAFHAAGEASVFVTLAGTLLQIDPNDARSRILLALVLTMAPFAVVGPLIGPALDRVRGGRRATIALSLLVRAVLMVLLMRNLDTAWFFPIAFAWLVLGKTYSVAKAATVPTTVDSEDELVDKNSRLAILSAVAGVVGVMPAAALYQLFGATPTLWFAAIVYMLGVVASTKMPRVFVDDPQTTEDDLDIRSAGVRLASFVMATLRSIVGFVFFLLVFEFVRSELPDLSGVGTAAGAAVKSALGFDLLEDPGIPWWKAAIPFGLWGFGGFAGNVIAPWFRRRFSEEKMLVGAVVTVAVAAIAAIWAGGLSGAALVALIVGAAASAAKLAFDSLVQRDAPGANHGAAFGRFETRFQIAWVVGSLLAVIIPFPLRAGFLVIAIAAIGIGVFIMQQGARSGLSFGGAPKLGTRRLRRRRDTGAEAGHDQPTPPPAPPAPPAPVVEPAPTTQMAAVRVPASNPATADPPGWASAVFDDDASPQPRPTTPRPPNQQPPTQRPPAQQPPTQQPLPQRRLTEPNPTPPMGTDRVV